MQFDVPNPSRIVLLFSIREFLEVEGLVLDGCIFLNVSEDGSLPLGVQVVYVRVMEPEDGIESSNLYNVHCSVANFVRNAKVLVD